MQNLPTQLYRAQQVRDLDRIAIEQYSIPGFDLMQRAALAVFNHIRLAYPAAQTWAIFCGGGNNAGDGYAIATLAMASGLKIRLFSVADTDRLQGDALLAYQQFIEAKGQVIAYVAGCLIDADVIVDALLGTGLNKLVSGLYVQAIENINASQIPVVAVDIPSGLNADTGNPMPCAVKAHSTVSFIGLKQGLLTGLAADFCGDIIFAGLGLPAEVCASITPSAFRVTQMDFPRRPRYAHKGHFGHVLVVGGDYGYTGAARLAAEAALRVGAGLVSIATRVAHAGQMNLNRPEMMSTGVENAAQLQVLLNKASVVVIGPGLGQTDWAKALLLAVLQAGKPMVVDADALNLLALAPSQHKHWVLTPHPAEAGRLLARPTAAVQEDRFAAVTALQAKYGGVVVLKGAGTLIKSAQDITLSSTGNPGMASGGMGDVLTGVIAALLAQGLALPIAAQQGVYLHGRAADLAALQEGERGLLASDLLPILRRLVNNLPAH
ncbi:MAG: NAD(P)H-hydrate dehydratase [Methylococcaceae bacterium]|jgi:NAD(P)H-hydrate epimerase